MCSVLTLWPLARRPAQADESCKATGTGVYSCDADGDADICQLNGTGDTFSCDLARNSEAGTDPGKASAYVLGGNIEVAGADGAGSTFCCKVDASGISRVELLGTSRTDHLFPYCAGSGCEGELLDYTDVTITGYVAGRGGGDYIVGSWSTSSYYYDELRGDAGADVIYGQEGDDTIFGGSGDDELYGEEGVDTIHGNADNDTISGGRTSTICMEMVEWTR